MLLGTELKTPFRWYDSKLKQTRFLPNCAGECLFKLFMPYNSLLPFQIRVQSFPGDKWAGEIVKWEIYNLFDAMAYDLTTYKADIVRFRSEGHMYFTYEGHLPMFSMEEGYYYSVITLETGGQLFSETFFVDRTPNKQYLKMQWFNSCDIGDIVFSFGNYKNELWLETPISRNEPSFIEEGIENGEKVFIPTIQLYTDNFTLDEYVPEFILSALTIVNMHESIQISEPNSNNVFVPVRNFKTQFTWEGADCFCVLTCRFQRFESIVKNRCCDNKTIERMGAYVVAELTNLSATVGFHGIPHGGSGNGTRVNWTATTTNWTGVEIKANFRNAGDEIVVVNKPANTTFVQGITHDSTIEITPFNIVNGRVKIYGTTYYIVAVRVP